MQPKHTFPLANYRNPFLYFKILQGISISAILLYSLSHSDSSITSLFLGFIALIGPLYIIHIMTSQLNIYDDHITLGSSFHRKKIMLDNVLSVKIYRQKGRFFGEDINENQANNLNWIYLSLKNTRKNNAVFQYKKELYSALKDWLNKP